MTEATKIAVIIVAAGSGTRAAAGKTPELPKQFQDIVGKPILRRTIECFLVRRDIRYIVPVIRDADRSIYAKKVGLKDTRLLPPVVGGATRQLSVHAGLESLAEHEPDMVLIHDGARPIVPASVIDNVILGLAQSDAVLPATAVIDTIKRSADGKTVGGTEDRTQLYAAQTPQGFDYKRILDAHRRALSVSDAFTDDTAIAEWAGMSVALSQGSLDNMKVTLPGDIIRAAQLIERNKNMESRTGSGLDVHQFEPGYSVVLGGIPIPHTHKLKGHSDADAALHVLTDALLGALAEGDIGTHFPPSDAKWRGEPSKTFLSFAANRVRERGGRIVNLDLTIMCEEPKIGPHVAAMRASIAGICNIEISRVSVKATTSEKMGFVGRGEGLVTMGTASIELPNGVTQ